MLFQPAGEKACDHGITGTDSVDQSALYGVRSIDFSIFCYESGTFSAHRNQNVSCPLFLQFFRIGDDFFMGIEFQAEKLHETIPNFHNTPDRYRAFLETLERDPMRRAAQVQPEIEFALARQSEMAALQTALKAGELPLRVTHNDTKLNNVLLDAKTRKALCVIDLDTVMPGSSLYDFGDSIRFGAATAAEDERDLSRMEMSLERFHVFTRGYVRSCPGLTQKELELLPLGAKTMTMECGVRFLTDYLDGDHYFAVHRDGQNLDRARTQFRLVADMEKKWNEMQKIVAEEANKER